MVSVIIMAGGIGERFWPRSRKKLPKQLLNLTNDKKSMIQLTVERIHALVEYEKIYIVTNQAFADSIRHKLPQIPDDNILVEPERKNTAPCIGFATVKVAKKDPDAITVILPSDHLIKDERKFINILKNCIEMAKKNENLITIGIRPTHAEKEYGYIKYDKKVDQIGVNTIYRVEKFIEKPSLEKAEEYILSGKYLWNSGIFIWKANVILKEYKKLMPNIYKGLMNIQSVLDTVREQKILAKEYNKFESISIDYGIMEHAEEIYTLSGDFGWDDLGSWTAFNRIKASDNEGNIIDGNIVGVNTRECILQGKNKLIATIGIENLIVIDTDDVTLICSKNYCKDIKKLLNKIREFNMGKYL